MLGSERAEAATSGLKSSFVQVSMYVICWVLLMTLLEKKRTVSSAHVFWQMMLKKCQFDDGFGKLIFFS